MPDPRDYNKPGLPKAQFERMAEARLREFQALRVAGPYVAAVYLAGYAVEAFLKSAICRTLDSPTLPKLFHFHNLDVLLYFSGQEAKMERDSPALYQNFAFMVELWNNGILRYVDPNDSNFSPETCGNVDKWLNDPQVGVVPWLKGCL